MTSSASEGKKKLESAILTAFPTQTHPGVFCSLKPINGIHLFFLSHPAPETPGALIHSRDLELTPVSVELLLGHLDLTPLEDSDSSELDSSDEETPAPPPSPEDLETKVRNQQLTQLQALIWEEIVPAHYLKFSQRNKPSHCSFLSRLSRMFSVARTPWITSTRIFV